MPRTVVHTQYFVPRGVLTVLFCVITVHRDLHSATLEAVMLVPSPSDITLPGTSEQEVTTASDNLLRCVSVSECGR